MHPRFRPTLALSVSLVLGASPAVLAQEKPRTDGDEARVSHAPQASLPSQASSGVLTGKERLGKKWMDEQRMDNCRIPLDKRGSSKSSPGFLLAAGGGLISKNAHPANGFEQNRTRPLRHRLYRWPIGCPPVAEIRNTWSRNALRSTLPVRPVGSSGPK